MVKHIGSKAAAPRYPYTTHTGLVLDVKAAGDVWKITITGDREKELGPALTEADAAVIADKWWAHYEERKQAEA